MLDSGQATSPPRQPDANAIRNVAWNYAGYVYQICINLGLTSYIARYLALPEYGLLLFVMSLSSALYLLDMGISSVLIPAYVSASLDADKERFTRLLSTTFWALAAFGVAGVLVFCLIASLLPGPFHIPQGNVHEAAILFIVASLVIQVSLPSIALEQAYQAVHRFDRVNQIQLASATLQLILSVLVLTAGFRIVALALVQLIVAGARLLLLAAFLHVSVRVVRLRLTHFRWWELKPLLHASKWAFLNNLSGSFFDFMAWAILGSLGSMREAALFGIASKLPMQLRNLVDRGAHVAFPVWSQASAKNDRVRLARSYLKVQKLVFGGLLPFIVLGFVFARPLLQLWAGHRYAVAGTVMEWLLLGALGYAVAYASDLILYACGQVRKAAFIAFAGGLASAVSGLLLVPRYGAAGLAAGMAASQLLINCVWFTFAACKICSISVVQLFRYAIAGLGWPVLALMIEVAALRYLSSIMDLRWLVLAAVLSGCVYLAIWGVRTARPLYRREGEVSA